MQQTDEEAVVRAAVAAVAKLPQDAVARLGDERTLTLLASATTEAVHRKYRSVPDSEQIRSYVQGLKDRFPDGADLIKPIVAEAVIRYAFGDEDVLGGIAVDDLRAMLFVLPYAIVSELSIQGEQLDTFVAKVIAEAN